MPIQMIECVHQLVLVHILWTIQQKDVYSSAQQIQICLLIHEQTDAFQNARATSLLTTVQGLALPNATNQLDTWHTSHWNFASLHASTILTLILENVLQYAPMQLHLFTTSTKPQNHVSKTAQITTSRTIWLESVCFCKAAVPVIMPITLRENVSWTVMRVFTCTKKMTPCNVSISVHSVSMVSTKTWVPNTAQLTVLLGGLRTTQLGPAFRHVPPHLPTTLTLTLENVLIPAEKNLTSLHTISTELASLNAQPVNSLTITQEDACQSVCWSQTLTSLWMELKESAFCNAQFNTLLITVRENVWLVVQVVQTIFVTGKQEPVWVFVLKLTQRSFMQTIKPEPAFLTVPRMSMETGLLTEIRSSEFACQPAQQCNTQIHQQVTVLVSAPGILIFTVNSRTSHASLSAIQFTKPMPKTLPEYVSRDVLPPLTPTTWLKDVWPFAQSLNCITVIHQLTSVY